MSSLNTRNQIFILFEEATNIIVDKLGLTNISLSILNKDRIVIVNGTTHLAALTYSSRNGFYYIFSDDIAKLTSNEMVFILLHEILHMILNHIEQKKTLSDESASSIAIDLVANDILNKILPSDIISKLKNEGIGARGLHPFFGPDLIGMDCSALPLKQVYDELLKHPNLLWEKKNYPDNATKTSQKSHLFHPKTNETKEIKYQEQLEEMKDILRPPDERAAPKATAPGTIGTSKEEIDIDFIKMRFKMDKVFHKIIGLSSLRQVNKKFNQTWKTPLKSRKGLDPIQHGILPAFIPKREKKPLVYFFIDTSGSINEKDLILFFNMLLNSPLDSWDLKCFQFDTRVTEIPMELIKSGKLGRAILKHGGGTSFSSVIEHVQETLTQKPNKCIVVTDGQGGDLGIVTDPDNWSWIINTDNYQSELEFFRLSKTFKRTFKLFDILKEIGA